MSQEREAYCTGLEALAAFLRANPECFVPDQIDFIQYVWYKDKLVDFVKVAGDVDKEYSENYATVCKNFGPVKYGMRIARETVCERRVVGKKTIPTREGYYIPSEPAHEEDIVEWDCKPILEEKQSCIS